MFSVLAFEGRGGTGTGWGGIKHDERAREEGVGRIRNRAKQWGCRPVPTKGRRIWLEKPVCGLCVIKSAGKCFHRKFDPESPMPA